MPRHKGSRNLGASKPRRQLKATPRYNAILKACEILGLHSSPKKIAAKAAQLMGKAGSVSVSFVYTCRHQIRKQNFTFTEVERFARQRWPGNKSTSHDGKAMKKSEMVKRLYEDLKGRLGNKEPLTIHKLPESNSHVLDGLSASMVVRVDGEDTVFFYIPHGKLTQDTRITVANCCGRPPKSIMPKEAPYEAAVIIGDRLVRMLSAFETTGPLVID